MFVGGVAWAANKKAVTALPRTSRVQRKSPSQQDQQFEERLRIEATEYTGVILGPALAAAIFRWYAFKIIRLTQD